jgi:ATP-dependent Clp protease ATP-binding subunit ClpA
MIGHSSEAAARFGHSAVSASHLLIGLMKVERGGPARMLKRAGLTLEMVERYVEGHTPPIEQTQAMAGALLGESAKIALEGAALLAVSMNERFVGIHGVLLAICDRDGTDASALLDAHRIDRAKLRQLLVRELAAPSPFNFYEIDHLLNETAGD